MGRLLVGFDLLETLPCVAAAKCEVVAVENVLYLLVFARGDDFVFVGCLLAYCFKGLLVALRSINHGNLSPECPFDVRGHRFGDSMFYKHREKVRIDLFEIVDLLC